MATSNEKLRALRGPLTDQMMAAVAGPTMGKFGPMAQLALASFRPRIDSQIDGYLNRPAAELDDLLGTIAATIAGLRSDDAHPIELEPAALELDGGAHQVH